MYYILFCCLITYALYGMFSIILIIIIFILDKFIIRLTVRTSVSEQPKEKKIKFNFRRQYHNDYLF